MLRAASTPPVDGRGRLRVTAIAALVGSVLAAALDVAAELSVWLSPGDAFRGIGHVGLSAIGFAVLSHVILAKRWPVATLASVSEGHALVPLPSVGVVNPRQGRRL